MKKLSMDKLVNTVINERKTKGLTQVQLAEATGINRAMIGSWKILIIFLLLISCSVLGKILDLK